MKSGRPKWLEAPRQVPITFEEKDLDTFKKSLPRNVSLSEGIRELIRISIDEKKVEAHRIPIVNQDIRQASMYEYINISINNLLGITEDTINDYIKTVEPKKLDQIYHKLGRFATCIAVMD